MKRLEGKVALITGGTSGIGAGTVERLRVEGATVIFTGSNQAAADALVRGDRRHLFFRHDVTDPSAWGALIAHILETYGRLDIAFANAGTERAATASIEDISIDGWNNVIGREPDRRHAHRSARDERAMAQNPDGDRPGRSSSIRR